MLRRCRVAAGFTQEELAERSGLSARAISNLERGRTARPLRASAELLASALALPDADAATFVSAARGGPRRAADTQPAPPGAVPDEAAGPDDDAGASNVVWIESAASRNIVGRTEERGVLRRAWSCAAAGRRVLALVGGEPGMGKTALVAELARQVRADGGLVLYGRWDEAMLAPYQAFRESLGDYARACPEAVLRRDLTDGAAEVARVCPELTRRIGASAAPPLAVAEAERFRLFEAVDAWIRRIAARHPVLLVLDDLHWADHPSLLLLRHLMEARRSMPLLAVAMYRDIELDQSGLPAALPSLARDIDCRRVTLRGLDRDAATSLLEATVGRSFSERESMMVAELQRETGGNPFLLQEMGRHLSELGASGRGVVRSGATAAEIPESVRDLIRWRLGRVSGACAEMLAVASVIGEGFDAAVLAGAAALDEAETVDALEEAARAGLVTEVDDEPDRWRFTQGLIRRVIADELSGSRTARLHQRIGLALESRPGVSPAELAHHFGAAAGIGSAAKAAEYERLAGQDAMAEVAAEVAVRHFGAAIVLLDRFGPRDRTLRCELLLDLAAAYDRAGDYASRDETFAAAAEAARRLGNDALFVRAALGYGGVLPAGVRPDPRARSLLEEAFGRLGDGDDAAGATILARLAHWLHYERPYARRLELSDRSVAMARAGGDRRTLATVLMHRCWALAGPYNAGDAIEVAGEILDIAAGLGEPELTLEGLRIKLMAQFEQGEHAAAVRTADELKRLAEDVHHPEYIRVAAMWDVTTASTEGRFRDAEKVAGELGDRLRRIGHPQARLISVAQTFSCRWLRGRAAEYIPVFEAMSAAEPTELSWPAVRAWCLAESGARDQAADVLHHLKPESAAAAAHNFQWWAMLVGFSATADLVGDRQWAETLYDLAAPYAGTNCTLGTACFLGAADHWLGVLAGTADRLPEAARHLEAALVRHRDLKSPPLTALTQEAYAHVLSRRGDPGDVERARTLTRSALRTADEYGLAAIRNRVRARPGHDE